VLAYQLGWFPVRAGATTSRESLKYSLLPVAVGVIIDRSRDEAVPHFFLDEINQVTFAPRAEGNGPGGA
jgi:hypothetical protein